MKLILMTRPEFFTQEHRIITALFEEGLDILHLRKPNTTAELSERLLHLIPENYHKRIVTHDHFHLQQEFALKGIHLNYRNPELPQNYKGHISCLCHNAEELKNRHTFCDYVFLSPMFHHVGGSNLHKEHDLYLLREWSQQKIINNKVMAMGNVSINNVALVKELGFGGCVVLGDIWNRFSMHKDATFKPLIAHFIKLKKLCL